MSFVRHRGWSPRWFAIVGLVVGNAPIFALEIPPPRSPAASLKAIHTKSNLVVELAAAEPLVMDPVAIDWDARGRMWVVEQRDYPNGMDGNWKPGGRVKILTSSRGDGHYDKATLFLDDLPFPTGITCWRNGVLICAAPDILYAEDTDGDGKADVVRKLFTGFFTDNYNARINSLALGLDNWIHGANGLLGGKIRSEKFGTVTDISGRDIRINPDTGELQLVSGVTQQGRARDDWDNWFGCSNSRWLFQFPLADRYVRRNPYVPAPASSLNVPADENAGELNPVSRPLERFNSPTAFGHVTSACGLGIYRDTLLGEEYYGNAFIGEVAHNLVRRFRLESDGIVFAGHRPKDEATTEFFASEDHWTRPVQIRTGPDGALYVVDMYRAVIEHTRWIPADTLAKLDVRAGDTMGRIYRVYPRGAKLRPVRDLTKLDVKELVAALDTPNGTTRDLVHLQLLYRQDGAAVLPLWKLAGSSEHPAVRAQALSVLDGLGGLTESVLIAGIFDQDPRVARLAIRLGESRLEKEPILVRYYLKLANHVDLGVRYQLALSLGEVGAPDVVEALASIARSDLNSPWLRAAVVSSSANQPMELLKAISSSGATESRSQLVGQLVATAAGKAQSAEEFAPLVDVLTPTAGREPMTWQLGGLGQMLDSIDRKKLKLAKVPGAEKVQPLFAAARRLSTNASAPEADREVALRLFARGGETGDADLISLADFVKAGVGERLQKAALAALARTRNAKVPELLLGDWAKRGPAQRLAVISTLLSREEWITKLLDAVETRVLVAADVPVASRQELARHANENIRKRAAALLPTAATGDRSAVIAKYQSVLKLQGDGAKGATVFANVCSSCHAYLGRGNEVGPNLSVFRPKPVQEFLVAILDPNAAIDARFTVYNVETKDGRSLAGIITSESATSIVLTQPGGTRENILRSDITELRASQLSLMPEGLESGLSPQDIADVIAFVKGGG